MDQPTPLATPVTPEPALYIPPVRPTPPAAPTAPQLTLHPKKKSKAGLIVGLIVGVILVLAGGTYAAARYGYITLPFPLPGTANDVIAKSLDALYNTTASESTSEFSMKIAPRDSSIPTLFPANSTTSSENTNTGLGLGNSRISSTGSMLELVPDNLAIAGSTTSYSEKTNEIGKLDSTMRLDATFGDTKVVADLAMRLLEKNIYLKVNVLDGIPNVDATSVVGKWFTTNISDAASLIPANTNTSDEELQKSRKTVQDILTLAQKHQLFTTKKNLGSETIEGIKTRHTSHALNPKQVAPFFEALVPVMKAAGQDTTGSDEFLAGLKKPETLTMLENMSKALTLDLWYDGKGKIMKKMAMTMVVVPPASSVKYKASQFVLAFSTTLKSSGQKKNIETPTGAEPMETLFSSMLSGTTGDEKTLTDNEKSTNDTQRKSDIASLKSGLALYFDDHDQYPTKLADLVPTYLTVLPNDPTTAGNYTFLFCDKNHVIIDTVLETSNSVYFSNLTRYTGEKTDYESKGIANGAVSCDGGFSYKADDSSSDPSTNVTNTNAAVEATDTDNDGVDDTTETFCGTKVDNKDSDNDGYDDLTEIQNGYNPNGAGKATSEMCKTYLDLQL